jgi:predicted nucleic acid-binding Zn ribbon protein
MATWDVTKYSAKCDKCGKKYNVEKFEQPVREKGRFNCTKCGNEMKNCNGSVDYTFTEA